MTSASRSAKQTQVLLIAAFMALVIFDRLYRIRDIGIDGCDTFYYLNTARDWAQGKVTLTAHYRPVMYLLGAAAFKLFGGAEHSLRTMHAVLDVGTVAIVLGLALAATRSLGAGLAAGAMYATLPTVVVWTARTETTRGPSTFFVAVAMAAFYLTVTRCQRRSSVPWAFALGLACSLAANVHPELALVGPGFGLAMALYLLIEARPIPWGRIPPLYGSLVAGFMLPFAVVVWYFGSKNVASHILRNSRRESVVGWREDAFSRIVELLPPRFFEEYTSESFRNVFLVVTLVGLLALLRRRKGLLPVALMAVPLACHFFGYAAVTSRYRPPTIKLFVPWLPWIMLWTIVSVHRLGDAVLVRRHPRLRNVLFAAGVVGMIAVNRGEYRNNVFISVAQPVAVYREAHAAIKDKLGPKRRAVLAPASLYANRQPAKQWPYFGPLGTYLLRTKGRGLKQIMARENAKFLVVFRERIDSRFRRQRFFGRAIRRIYGKKHGARFSQQREYAALTAFADKQRARIAFESPRVTVYEFP